jgi:hypothetical protein
VTPRRNVLRAADFTVISFSSFITLITLPLSIPAPFFYYTIPRGLRKWKKHRPTSLREWGSILLFWQTDRRCLPYE